MHGHQAYGHGHAPVSKSANGLRDLFDVVHSRPSLPKTDEPVAKESKRKQGDYQQADSDADKKRSNTLLGGV